MNKLLDGNMLLVFTNVNLTGFILSSLNISVKLSISFENYIIYINNKVFK